MTFYTLPTREKDSTVSRVLYFKGIKRPIFYSATFFDWHFLMKSSICFCDFKRKVFVGYCFCMAKNLSRRRFALPLKSNHIKNSKLIISSQPSVIDSRDLLWYCTLRLIARHKQEKRFKERIIILQDPNVENPSDINGLLYETIADDGKWKERILTGLYNLGYEKVENKLAV